MNYYGGAVSVTICLVNALARNGYEVILYADNEIRNREVASMMGDPICSSVKTIVKRTMFKPRWLFDMYQNAFRSWWLKQKCDILVDTFSNFIFPWTDGSYVHFPYFNDELFRPNFPYLNSKNVYDLINIPLIIFSRKIGVYKRRWVIANSRFTADSVKRSLGTEADVVFPPVDSSFFKKGNELTETREDLVVSVGRISSDKRLETLPRIAHLTNDKIRFTIMGFVHEKAAYELISKEIKKLQLDNRFVILRDLTKKSVIDYLIRAKVYLHPPITEHFGISIAEAMATGCIPIVYDSGGVREFVPPEYRYRDLDEAADKVEDVIESWSTEKSREMIQIAQKFSVEAFSKGFMNVFLKHIQ